MQIDSLKLMFQTFQSCRHTSEDRDILARTLYSTLETVRQDQMCIVSIPKDALYSLSPYVQQESLVSPNEAEPTNFVWSVLRQHLFPLAHVGTQELMHFIDIDSKRAIRALGYVLHVIPRYLQAPERFDRERYQFCFGIAADHWDTFSPDMHNALCAVIDQDIAPVSQLVQTDGFIVEWV